MHSVSSTRTVVIGVYTRGSKRLLPGLSSKKWVWDMMYPITVHVFVARLTSIDSLHQVQEDEIVAGSGQGMLQDETVDSNGM